MKIQCYDRTVTVRGLRELGASNAQPFRDEVCAALPDRLHALEIDLSEAASVDAWGLGALVSIYKSVQRRTPPVVFRLLAPPLPVQQVLELTQMHHLFEIVPGPCLPPAEPASVSQPAAA